MSRNNLRRALACASAIGLVALSTSAAAQQIERIVAFGDSYADTGNAFALGYANPAALTVYPTGRFSGGSNYIDTLGQILQVPVQDFAIGGAFGGSNNGTLCFDSFYAPGTSPLCGKGLQYQIDQFLNVGTQSPVFPSASTTFTRSDLLAISIGGNDSRFYQKAGGTLANAATAGTAAASGTAAQLDRLVGQGKPTISFLSLNSAIAPEVANDPNAQAIRGAFSNAYYSSLQTTLAGYAANGSIVHYLDSQVLLQNVLANPAAYGASKGLVCPIFPDPTCLVDSSGYLFYGDALHLTSGGFALLAKYVGRQLAAPLTLEAPSDLELATARQFGRTLSSRSDLYARGGGIVPGVKLFANGDYFSSRQGPSDQNSAFDITGGGVTLGAELGLPVGAVGIAANYSRPRARFDNDSSSVHAHSWQLGAYGGVALGGLFGQAYAGYGHDHDRIDRSGVVDGMTASPNGSHVTAGAKGGYLMPLGPVTIGPIVALDYAHAKVDSYTESGDPVLTLNVGSESAKSLTGQFGLEARGDLEGLRAFGAITAEHQFSGDGASISFAQTDAPIIVNRWDVRGHKGTYARASFGGAATILGSTSLDAALSTTVGRHGGEEIGAHLGLRAAF